LQPSHHHHHPSLSFNPHLSLPYQIGYNGDYSGINATFAARRAFYGTNRTDGKPWIWPNNVHPYRFYLGVKGLMEDGSKAPASDFLARNGLRYGQIYGYAIDMTSTGPTKGAWRDAAHKNATNGLTVPGQWVAQPWRWNGTVTDFQHDGSWDFQLPVPGLADYKWWNSAGYDAAGEKCEHLSPVSKRAWLACRLSGWNALSHDILFSRPVNVPISLIVPIGPSGGSHSLYPRVYGRVLWPLLR
jgi:hypothetical protein